MGKIKRRLWADLPAGLAGLIVLCWLLAFPQTSHAVTSCFAILSSMLIGISTFQSKRRWPDAIRPHVQAVERSIANMRWAWRFYLAAILLFCGPILLMALNIDSETWNDLVSRNALAKLIFINVDDPSSVLIKMPIFSAALSSATTLGLVTLAHAREQSRAKVR